MPKDLTKEQVNIGRVVYEWWVKEYEQYERTRRWYLVMGGIGLALVIFAIFTNNYLFALVIVLFGLILYLHDMLEPMEVYFAITEAGIIMGKKFYRYNEVANFWVIYNPPQVKSLYFSLDNLIKHRLQIPLSDYDPRPIRNFLAQYLEEDMDQEDEPLSDKMARLLKIH